MHHPFSRTPALFVITLVTLLYALLVPPAFADEDLVDLRGAILVVRGGDRPVVERTAAHVLQQEVERRTRVPLPAQETWPTPQQTGVVIALATAGHAEASGIWPTTWPSPDDTSAWRRPDGYRVVVARGGPQTTIFVTGHDPRGTLYGVGEVLRALRWSPDPANGAHQGVPATLDVSTAPDYAIRGHQLGYRATANSYDGWDAAQYEQYIRDLALFGVNAIENIPFQDARPSPHFTLPRERMTQAISEICARYGLDYWLWVPADFDLHLADRREEGLAQLERMAATLPKLDAIFVPGGDPGHNPAPLVFPYLADIASRIRRHHPQAKVWVSLQQFKAPDIDWVFTHLSGPPLPWFGGLVGGPSSPPLEALRSRLPASYALRDYPDITHVVRSQYPLAWDPALNFTLGREPINPRPQFYASLHDRLAPFTNGAITYSDGAHDDVNKVIWSQRAWSRQRQPMDVLRDYARLFFGAPVADAAAEGIAALERNWEGPLQQNAGVDATLEHWQRLRAAHPRLEHDWRWQMMLFRAYYDAYTKHRQQREQRDEDEALAALRTARTAGSRRAIAAARTALRASDDAPGCAEWRRQIDTLAEALFQSIRLQTSVERYGASGAERGAVMDFVDHPLNNRWWLEDEFVKVEAMADEAARSARLETLATWASPPAGSFYDDIGNIADSPRVVTTRPATGDAPAVQAPTPHFTWEEQGRSRKRLSWLTSLRWPPAIRYTDLVSSATYVVRLNGNGDVRLRIDGRQVEARTYSTTLGEPKEYVVPPEALADGVVTLTFDEIDESDRNWRQHSRLNEVWLLRQ
jgi:hypothetical protein